MNDAEQRPLATAARQRQVFARRQAREPGLSQNAITRRIADGRLVRVGPNTLTFAGVRLDWRGRLQAGLLDLGPSGRRHRGGGHSFGSTATTRARTFIALLGRVDRRCIGNALDSACRMNLTSPAEIERRLHQLGQHGRAAVADHRARRETGDVQSWLEREFLQAIAGSGLPRPLVQRTYHGDGVHVARRRRADADADADADAPSRTEHVR